MSTRLGPAARLFVLGTALGALAAPLAGQQADTTLTAEQRALARLRALGEAAQVDSLRPVRDSVAPQTVVVGGRAPVTAAPAMERDSVMRMLMGIDGYTATEYRGDSARFSADSSRLLLRLNARVARDGNQLAADSSITYDERLALACGYGQPVLQGAAMTNPVVSDTVCYDIERQLGRAPGASTRVEEGAQWNVRCDAYFAGEDLYCHDAIFSDCDLPYPHQHYHFAARELKVVRGNVMVARDLTMNFADVPVFWLPFMVQSLSRGRRSGVLMPRFGVNDIARTNSGYNRRIEDVGVYWAINDNMGAELALDWFSNNWTGLRGSLDYNFPNRFLAGGLTFRQFWKEEGGRDMTLSTRNRWEIDERTRLNVTGNYATSARFVQSRTLDPRELNRNITSNASLSRRFDWGNMEAGARRKQSLHDNAVELVLPDLSVTSTPITLFEAQPGEEQWFSNMTWTGRTGLRAERKDIGEASTSLSAQSTRDVFADASTSLRLGRVSTNQSISFTDRTGLERELPVDSLGVIQGYREREGTWSAGLSYQQPLIGTSTFTPGVSVSGNFLQHDSLGAIVHSPARVNFNASLRTDVFGFWPGVGPFSALRHRLSPSFSYRYSPAATASPLQEALFQGAAVRENNQITIGLNQTWEAKYRSVEVDSAGMAETGAVDSTGATAGAAASGEPRRRQQTRTVMLLSLATDAVTYDFVDARTGEGLQTTQISNRVQSDLLRGLQLSFSHDLFSQGDDDGVTARQFAPHLSRVNASFSLNNQSWLFRVLRLGSRDTMPNTEGTVPLETGDATDAGPATDLTESEDGMIGTSRRSAPGAPRGSVGSWNASFNYTLYRPREPSTSSENQMVTANISFQPTVNWGLQWNTGYSFTSGSFSDHMLTLTRTLHDWDANFSFVKAQNGNFSFQFGVYLRANPDIKVDYSQSDMPGVERVTGAR